MSPLKVSSGHASGRRPRHPSHQSVLNGSLRRRCLSFAITIALLTTLVIYYWNTQYFNFSKFVLPSSTTHHVVADMSSALRWDDIEPGTSLHYRPCFGPFQCARLSVPLNWNTSAEEQAAGPRAAIAVIKLPAKVPVTDPRYGGPILVNPGGPGESGVYQVLAEGRHIQTVVDAPDAPENSTLREGAGKYFDILSFDPRGVNNTTPKLRCFPDAFNQQAWSLGYLDFGLLWSSENVIGYEWARASALGASCASEAADDGILRYANTAQVVEDMVQIIEKDGEWRATEAERLTANLKFLDESTRDSIRQRTAHRVGREKLQYWGVSYGTVIGLTFAALHPERVSRVILDGVVDPVDHYAGDWLTQLLDSDKIITRFSEYCFQAGRDKCPLYTGFSPSEIEARFTSIMLSLKQSPIPITLSPADVENAGPEIVTYGDAHLYMLSSMYFTYATAEVFWDMLLALESRNTTSRTLIDLAAAKQARLSPSECHEDEASVPLPCVPYSSMLGPNQAIGCMDIGGRPNLTFEGYQAYLGVLEAQSRWISPSWARNKLGCLGHEARPAWRPDLSFETQAWENTSHPLLIIGNSHDPVTPIRNARRVSTLFPGSVVLQQNSEGHCSPSNPSLCTAKAVKEYFQTGKLPREGSVCEPEVKPFVGCVNLAGCDFAGSEDGYLWESMVELADPFGLRKQDVDANGLRMHAWEQVFRYKGLRL
jgi:pimeloyl-ACP methyl ester carboxylesterase